MNLYLISQTVNSDYDTYDSCMVCAETANAARYIHPDENSEWIDGSWSNGGGSTWCHPRDVDVLLIGKAAKFLTKPKVICASFNAG